jgi:competence protein ComEA
VFSKHQIFAVAIAVACLSPAALPSPPNNAHTLPASESRVDINHASLDELLHVSGMTPSWAGRIIRFRPYRTKDDLVQRGVLTGPVYMRIKDYVIAHRKAQ